MNFIAILGWIIAAAALLIFTPLFIRKISLDNEIIAKNQKAKEQQNKIEFEIAELQVKREQLINKNDALIYQQLDLTRQVEDYQKHSFEAVEKLLDKKKEQSQKEYEEAKNEYISEYQDFIRDRAIYYASEMKKINTEIHQKENELNNLDKKVQEISAVVASAVEANKRAAEMETKNEFYKINLSPEDKEEIIELRKCLVHLRNPEPLNKVIWKTYYEKPTTDMIGRVVGAGTHCGIYKITNLTSGMCYVGQSVNISERWKQHIKRGIGADTPTKNKLYPAMLAEGVENFSFEIIEECPQNALTDKEKFWTDFFKAQEFGYSIRKG